MAFELSRNAEFTIDRSSATNSTGRINGTVVDMQGYDSVLFLLSYGTTNAGADSHLSMEMGTASTTDTFSDATGDVLLSKTGLYLDVQKPTKRYVRGVSISTASGKSRVLTTIRYNPRVVPTTQNVSTTGLRLYSPGSGTATG